MKQHLIVYPMAALVLLCAIVAGRMLLSRIGEMKAKRIHPQAVANRGQMTGKMENTQAADNYLNLFEMPVLFFALCSALLALQWVDTRFVTLAWVYVALRCVHSFIHCTYNKVMHRLYAFISSATVLTVMWVMLVVKALQQAA